MSFDFNTVFYIAPFLALAIAVLSLVLSVVMQVRVSRIFRSASATDIERLLKLHTKTLEDFVRFKVESTEYMKSLDQRLKNKTVNASTVRFNSLLGKGEGGNQSFSSVFADEEGNGVIITSMYTRERTNIFAKPIKNWQSQYELTTEEKKVIANRKEVNS